jgi:hypothetical protein
MPEETPVVAPQPEINPTVEPVAAPAPVENPKVQPQERSGKNQPPGMFPRRVKAFTPDFSEPRITNDR